MEVYICCQPTRATTRLTPTPPFPLPDPRAPLLCQSSVKLLTLDLVLRQSGTYEAPPATEPGRRASRRAGPAAAHARHLRARRPRRARVYGAHLEQQPPAPPGQCERRRVQAHRLHGSEPRTRARPRPAVRGPGGRFGAQRPGERRRLGPVRDRSVPSPRSPSRRGRGGGRRRCHPNRTRGEGGGGCGWSDKEKAGAPQNDRGALGRRGWRGGPDTARADSRGGHRGPMEHDGTRSDCKRAP